jgi:alanine dehydrogenase
MIIGIPTEVKTAENRVAMTPDGVRGLTSLGHEVRVQSGAGTGSSFSDADFVAVGARMVTAAEAWASELVCKVKEPQESEFGFLREDLVLFTYLHLAAYPEVAKALFSAKTTGIAYETVQSANGDLPLLAPMSEVAGRIATQVGACSAACPACEPPGSSSSAPATSAGTPPGSLRAWRPRCSSSTATSTGCAGSTRSTRAGS